MVGWEQNKLIFFNITFSLCTYYEQFICTRTSEDKNNFTNAKRIKYEI